MNSIGAGILFLVFGAGCVYPQSGERERLNEVVSKHTQEFLSMRKSEDIDFATTLNVKEFGAKGDGKTNDTKAVNDAIKAVGQSGKSTLFFPNGTYIIEGNGISLQGVKLMILGQSNEKTIIKGKGATNLFVTRGVVKDSLIMRNLKFDASDVRRSVFEGLGSFLKGPILIENCVFLNANLYNIRLDGVDNAHITGNTFRGSGIGKGMGVYLIRGCSNISISHNRFLYLYNGVYIVGKNSKTKQTFAPNTDITFTDNYLDFGWFLLPSRYSNSGEGVTYTANTISDTKGNFKTIQKKTNVRVLRPLGKGTITRITENVKLIDKSADYLRMDVKPGDLIRVGNRSGLVKSVTKNLIEIEKWYNQDNLFDTTPPMAGDDYTISRIIIGKIDGNTANIIRVTRFYDFFGNIVTPKSGWKYEVLNPRPNYPFFSTVNNKRFTISDNTFMRGWSDQVSVKGDQHKILNNVIRDGQDMGITLHGQNHQIVNNKVIHQRTGIWVASSNSVIKNNKIVDCQWGGYYKNRQIGYMHVVSGKNNTISGNDFERIHVKAEKNIRAIIRSRGSQDNNIENNEYDAID